MSTVRPGDSQIESIAEVTESANIASVATALEKTGSARLWRTSSQNSRLHSNLHFLPSRIPSRIPLRTAVVLVQSSSIAMSLESNPQ